MPVLEFNTRFQGCPCPLFPSEHKRVVSNGYTEPCRVVGATFTYAMVGNRYICPDCRDLKKMSYTFNSYDDRVIALLPPDIR
jgi:transposase-like protein